MSYSIHIITAIRSAPDGLGSRLGKLAVFHNIPAARIALASGATRQTVYNWMKGGDVLVPYRPAVKQLINIMSTSRTHDDAWRKICKEFNLQT